MPARVVQYAYTEHDGLSEELNIDALDPVHKVRAILEQIIYKSYLKMTVRNITSCVQDYFNQVDQLILHLPEIDTNLDGPDSTLYHTGIDAIKRFPHAPIATYDALLSNPSESPYWKPTISREFYLPLLYMLSGNISNENSDVGSEVLLPTLEVYERPLLNTSHDPKQGLRIMFRRISLASFDYKERSDTYGNAEDFLSRYLINFNYTDWTMDHFIGVFANFCIEPGRHAMRNHKEYTRGIADICYEIVYPPKHYGRPNHPYIKHGEVYGVEHIMDMFSYLVTNNRIGTTTDTNLLAEFLAKCGRYSQEIVDYIAKPMSQVTTLEAMAFRSSDLVKFIPDKTQVALEDDTPDINTEDGNNPSGNQDIDPNAATTNPDPLGDVADSEPKKDVPPPKRKPGQLLVALADSDEKLSDCLYRRVVSERMATIIANPPLGIPTSEILLMKRYLALWINLLSVASIKDYVSRLSFQLMNDPKHKGSEKLD